MVVEDGSVTVYTSMLASDKDNKTWNNDWYVQWRVGMKDPASTDTLTKWEFAWAELRNKDNAPATFSQKCLEDASKDWKPDITDKDTGKFNN